MPGTGGSGEAGANDGSHGSGGWTAEGTGGAPNVGGQGTGGQAAGGQGAGGQGAGGQGASGGTSSAAGGSGGSGGSSSGELCEWGSYDTDQTDDQLTCKEWTQCQPGEYLADEGGFWSDNVCKSCPAGTVTEVVNERRCREWHLCELGEQVVAEPTASSDRQCAPSELFAPYSGRALDLFLNNDAPELIVMQSTTFVASYSAAGQRLGEVTLSPGVKDGIDDQALDFALLGDELFAVGVTTSALGSPGYVRKISDSGLLDWEIVLGDETDVVSSPRIAAADDAIYVVARLDEGAEDSAIELYVLDPVDGSLSNPALEGYPVGTPIDIAAATNGHVYMAGLATAASRIAGVTTVTEFDATGSLIAETELTGSRLLFQLAADDAGGVHALGGPLQPYPSWHFSHHLGSGGLQLSTATLTDGNGWQMDALTSTPAGVLVVGRTPEHPVLLTVDVSGQVTSTEVLEDIAAPERFAGVRQALDGTVFVAGTNVSPQGDQVAFVAQWPD